MIGHKNMNCAKNYLSQNYDKSILIVWILQLSVGFVSMLMNVIVSETWRFHEDFFFLLGIGKMQIGFLWGFLLLCDHVVVWFSILTYCKIYAFMLPEVGCAQRKYFVIYFLKMYTLSRVFFSLLINNVVYKPIIKRKLMQSDDAPEQKINFNKLN